MKAVKLNETETKCLVLLADAYDTPEQCILFFKHFVKEADLTLTQAKRAVRGLARKGLAEYSRCFDSDDGHVCGSGYMVTSAGRALQALLVPGAKIREEA